MWWSLTCALWIIDINGSPRGEVWIVLGNDHHGQPFHVLRDLLNAIKRRGIEVSGQQRQCHHLPIQRLPPTKPPLVSSDLDAIAALKVVVQLLVEVPSELIQQAHNVQP